MKAARPRSELREVARTAARPREPITHVVLFGKYHYPAYQKADTLYSVNDHKVLAFKRRDGSWSEQVKLWKDGRSPTDKIKPVWPAVKMNLDKGVYY